MISSFGEKKSLTHIKCSNFMPKTMVMHQDLNRLYVSMKEGILFIFDLKDITPIVLHTIIFPYYVKRISIDTNINLL